MSKLDGKNAVVVGASRGLGRGVAESLSAAGASVFAIAREYAALEELQAAHRSIEVAVADATDPTLAGRVIDEQEPDILVVIAGASPLLHPIHQHTWETFSLNWEVDVRLTFNWLREALLKPLRPGSRVLLMSSAAATHGSPMSGGYAGAKATIRFMAAYADDESRRQGLGIRVIAILPRLTPTTELGLATVRTYAAREGISEEQFRRALGAPLTPERAGDAFLELAAGELDGAVAYALTGDDGLTPLPTTP
ncbi:MAG: SDR family oxidoreductase [Solirubrobacterales bacterium]|nr:SDR family oxidoreductase [Solirubrobacterales bacterium]MBV9534444.1 SDR family oxidoreductase [Solirubrobacterales bacterium]